MANGAGDIGPDLTDALRLISMDESERELAHGSLTGLIEPIAHMVLEVRARVESMSRSVVQQHQASGRVPRQPPGRVLAMLRQVRVPPPAGLGGLEGMVEAALVNVRSKRLGWQGSQHANPGAGQEFVHQVGK